MFRVIILILGDSLLNYKKVLIAKYFPKDHCYADDCDILVFASENDKRPEWIKNDEEFFVSLKDRTPSLFGDVQTFF